MGKSKVIYNDETLIDISNDSVVAAALLKDYTAHDSNGELVKGELELSSDADTVDGWHVNVISDGSDPGTTTKPTIHFVYTAG
jgi:hypothetical protein